LIFPGRIFSYTKLVFSDMEILFHGSSHVRKFFLCGSSPSQNFLWKFYFTEVLQGSSSLRKLFFTEVLYGSSSKGTPLPKSFEEVLENSPKKFSFTDVFQGSSLRKFPFTEILKFFLPKFLFYVVWKFTLKLPYKFPQEKCTLSEVP